MCIIVCGILCIMEIASTITLGVYHFIAIIGVAVGVGVWVTNLVRNVKDNTEWRKENKSLMARLAETFGSPNKKYAGAESPISLTTDGTTLLKESGAEEYIERNKENLLKKFKHVTEPYDIQKKAGDVMIEELVKDKNIKSFLYRNGEKMIDVADVASIALRDIVLEHKGIAIEGYKG